MPLHRAQIPSVTDWSIIMPDVEMVKPVTAFAALRHARNSILQSIFRQSDQVNVRDNE